MALTITGVLQKRLYTKLKQSLSPVQELEVTVKLHLIMPNADKKDPQFREVTLDNYQECFSLLRESALFEFGAFDLSHPISLDEEQDRRELSKE